MMLADHEQFEAKRPGFLATRKGARIVRLSAQVLWLPKAGPEAEAVIVAREEWSAIHERCPGLHPFEAVPRARRRDLFAAWIMSAPSAVRERGEDGLLALLRDSLVAADGLEKADALASVESLARAAMKRPDEPVAGEIAAPDPDDSVRTLYLDTHPTADWPAIARVGGEWAFAFGPGLVFREAPAPDEAEESAAAGTGGRQLTFSFL